MKTTRHTIISLEASKSMIGRSKKQRAWFNFKLLFGSLIVTIICWIIMPPAIQSNLFFFFPFFFLSYGKSISLDSFVYPKINRWDIKTDETYGGWILYLTDLPSSLIHQIRRRITHPSEIRILHPPIGRCLIPTPPSRNTYSLPYPRFFINKNVIFLFTWSPARPLLYIHPN